TGLGVELYGLGAGEDGYIFGSAKANGHAKGDADLHIKGTDIYIEVTGPLNGNVPEAAPLWLRPDKIDNAIAGLENGHDTFFAHYTPSARKWRIIHADNSFIDRYRSGIFKLITPKIRGRVERYIEISSSDSCITDLDYLINYLNNTTDTDKKDYQCPNCGALIIKTDKGYYLCSGKCGMYLSLVYGTDIGNENVERLLSGESCEMTTKSGIRTLIELSVVRRYISGKTYINWKTKNI
ncbi:MAG: hypothetical protein IJ555_02470, partial [Ruminococcus sp.]|nr:hypothetical protein [Ruminococcus sp.]